MRLVDRDKAGSPVFGRGGIVGWQLARDRHTTERTLRNAALAAFLAEVDGDPARAYSIWTHELESGELVWQAFARGLPGAVATLGGIAAGFSLGRSDVRALVDVVSRSLGRQPEHPYTGEWKGPRVLLWTWPMSAAWVAVDINVDGMARECTVRPEPSELAPRGESISGPTMGPTMAEILGEDLPSFSVTQRGEHDEAAAEAKVEREAIQAEGEAIQAEAASERHRKVFHVLGLAEPRLFALLATARNGHVRTQRNCAQYRQCLACKAVVGAGHKWVSDTGRSRIHAACETTLRPAFDRSDGHLLSGLLGDLRERGDR